MFKREIESLVREYSKKYRAIALVGPRQSGKTTLSRSVFPNHSYHSLENPDVRSRAIHDPRGFLSSNGTDLIIDEIQYAPDLFSYLQEHLDDPTDSRQFILTGSNSFQLSERISQSLAGRVRVLTILPFYREEFPEQVQPSDLNESLFLGGYPRIFNEDLNPQEWHADYYNTYIQKDVRTLLEVGNISLFDRFVRIIAGRIGQLSNYSSVATEVGVEQPTIKKWMSVLEASFIVTRLEPHFRNFNKRIIKSPKYYFYDTGLLCYLLRIQSSSQLENHPLRGEIFENWVISEAIKFIRAKGREPALYFWRDQHGHEIDIVIDRSTHLEPIEIKSGKTFQRSWLKSLEWFNNLQQYDSAAVVYGGEESFSFQKTDVVSWHSFVRKLFC